MPQNLHWKALITEKGRTTNEQNCKSSCLGAFAGHRKQPWLSWLLSGSSLHQVHSLLTAPPWHLALGVAAKLHLMVQMRFRDWDFYSKLPEIAEAYLGLWNSFTFETVWKTKWGPNGPPMLQEWCWRVFKIVKNNHNLKDSRNGRNLVAEITRLYLKQLILTRSYCCAWMLFIWWSPNRRRREDWKEHCSSRLLRFSY